MAPPTRLLVVFPLFLIALNSVPVSGRDLLALQAAPRDAQLADSLIQQWGQRPLLEVADMEVTAHSVIQGTVASSAYVVAIRGLDRPARRDLARDEPFLAVVDTNSTELRALSTALALPLINQGAQLLERGLSRPLYPLRLQPTDFTAGPGGRTPFAVYDVSCGSVALNRRQLDLILNAPSHMIRVVERFAVSLLEQLADFAGKEPPASAKAETEKSAGRAAAVLARISTAALGLAFASMVPLWFCIACPIVLGLLAPLVFNGALGTAAELLCSHYQLPDDECAELWYGAFAVAAVLSLASAIPIAYICHIPECGRQ